MNKATKKLRHYSQSAGSNLNTKSTKYDAVLSSQLRRTVYWGYNNAGERCGGGKPVQITGSRRSARRLGARTKLCCQFLSFLVVSVFVDCTNSPFKSSPRHSAPDSLSDLM